jgi:hypothetical protein
MPQPQVSNNRVLKPFLWRGLAALIFSLFIGTQVIQAQLPVCLPTSDWRVNLAFRGGFYLARAAKKARQQDNASQQAWKASKTSAAGVRSAPVNGKDLWLAGKSAATPEAAAAPAEKLAAPVEVNPAPKQESAQPLNPAELLAAARTIFVRSTSVWVKRKSIEDALMKKKEFRAMGLAIVKDVSEADLKLEVDHTPLTLRYPFTVTHIGTQAVVATGTVHSLRILNDVPGDTAGSFLKQVKAARAVALGRAQNAAR